MSAAGFSQANSLQESEALVSLLRNPRTFAKVVDILGHNIYCYHAHLNVRSHHAASVSLSLSLLSRNVNHNHPFIIIIMNS